MLVEHPGPVSLTVAIMAFNRPRYLKNCIDSVRRFIPDAQILVVDDASDDPEQAAVLREAEQNGARVLTGGAESSWHGGLYGNMQRALDECQTSLLLYLQDDTQIVRPVTLDDVQHAKTAMDDVGAAFAYPFFIKGAKRRHWPGRFVAIAGNRALQPRPFGSPEKVWIGYADICVARVAALRSVDWKFSRGESQNDTHALALFRVGMIFLADPWGFYCPEVPIFRNREKNVTITHRVFSRRKDEGTFFSPMTEAKVQSLINRPVDELPFAEDWLETRDPKIKRPFAYADMKRNRMIWLAYSFELWLRRLLAR